MGDLIPIPLLTAVEVGNTQTVRRLIDEGADINVQSKLHFPHTALTTACRRGHLEMVDLLIKAGANLELGEPTPMMFASFEGHENLVTLLLKQGANINVQGRTHTALAAACHVATWGWWTF